MHAEENLVHTLVTAAAATTRAVLMMTVRTISHSLLQAFQQVMHALMALLLLLIAAAMAHNASARACCRPFSLWNRQH